jgi:hypothetical protein
MSELHRWVLIIAFSHSSEMMGKYDILHSMLLTHCVTSQTVACLRCRSVLACVRGWKLHSVKFVAQHGAYAMHDVICHTQECAGLRSRLEAAQRHCRTLEAERNGAQERLAAAQAREQALQQVGRLLVRCHLSYVVFVNLHAEKSGA